MRVSVLGEQAIVDDESGSVRTRSSRAVVFVAFLALHVGSPQPRQRIAGLFWPDSTDAQALTNLRRELHYLRQVLGDDPSLIVTSRDLCWCDTGTCRVDLRVFDTERKAALAAAAAGDDQAVAEHAAAAMAEYRGDLLPGADDDWLLEARAVLRRQCVDLCDVACAARIRAGDLGRAVDVVRRRLQLEPLEEVGYRTLMQLQADLGDRAGAISTYHHCAAVLERELGVLPDAATRKAFQGLVGYARPPEGPAVAAGRGSSRLGPAAAPLIGRSGELAMLEELWQAAVAGQPGIVLVRGSPGVGKTRLVAEIAGKAGRHGAVVASTQCFGATGRVALAPVADWLRNPAVQSAAAALDPVWRAEVSRLVPAGGHGAPASGARAMADAWQRHRFFEGLARALHAVGRPLFLVLDNLQWCDQETLAFVAFCLALTDRAELLVVGTARGDGRGDAPDLADWIVQMRTTGMLAEFPLSPLEADDTARLARAVSGQPFAGADAELLHATTGGFPLFVIEAVRSSANLRSTPLPSGDLSAVLRKRLEQPSAPAREVAGLGGIGYLSRRFGLTVDNLLAADVVLADGTFVTASDGSHSDLLWALRGGGNFGVVTSFTFRCHDIGEGGMIIGGPVLYDFADTAEVMRWYRELLPALPEELSGWIGLITIPPAPPFPRALWGRKSCAIVWCYTGPHDHADKVLEPVRSFGSPLLVGLHAMPFTVLQSAFDPLYPAGLQWYWRADFFNEISDEAIDVHVKYGQRLPTGHSTMHLYPIDGAAARVPEDATAFAYRDGGWAGVIVGVDPDPAHAGLISQWARDYWQELHPTSAGGAYVNFLMNEGQERVQAAYRGNYNRLAQIKSRYDPDNVFHINQNIQPATQPNP